MTEKTFPPFSRCFVSGEFQVRVKFFQFFPVLGLYFLDISTKNQEFTTKREFLGVKRS